MPRDGTDHDSLKPPATAIAVLTSATTAPGFSIATLARQAVVCRAQWEGLEALQREIGLEPKPGPGCADLNRPRLRQRQVQHAMDAVSRQEMAIEDLILVSRAVTVPDALAQIVVASTFVDSILSMDEDSNNPVEGLKMARKIEHALESAMRAIGAQAGVPLASVGGVYMMGVWSERWPELAVVQQDDDIREAADGSQVTL